MLKCFTSTSSMILNALPIIGMLGYLPITSLTLASSVAIELSSAQPNQFFPLSNPILRSVRNFNGSWDLPSGGEIADWLSVAAATEFIGLNKAEVELKVENQARKQMLTALKSALSHARSSELHVNKDYAFTQTELINFAEAYCFMQAECELKTPRELRNELNGYNENLAKYAASAALGFMFKLCPSGEPKSECDPFKASFTEAFSEGVEHPYFRAYRYDIKDPSFIKFERMGKKITHLCNSTLRWREFHLAYRYGEGAELQTPKRYSIEPGGCVSTHLYENPQPVSVFLSVPASLHSSFLHEASLDYRLSYTGMAGWVPPKNKSNYCLSKTSAKPADRKCSSGERLLPMGELTYRQGVAAFEAADVPLINSLNGLNSAQLWNSNPTTRLREAARLSNRLSSLEHISTKINNSSSFRYDLGIVPCEENVRELFELGLRVCGVDRSPVHGVEVPIAVGETIVKFEDVRVYSVADLTYAVQKFGETAGVHTPYSITVGTEYSNQARPGMLLFNRRFFGRCNSGLFAAGSAFFESLTYGLSNLDDKSYTEGLLQKTVCPDASLFGNIAGFVTSLPGAIGKSLLKASAKGSLKKMLISKRGRALTNGFVQALDESAYTYLSAPKLNPVVDTGEAAKTNASIAFVLGVLTSR